MEMIIARRQCHMDTRFQYLFTPGRIGSMEVKNRIIMPAMGTGMHGPEGEVIEQAIDYYATRARGGTGMVTVEIAAVHPTTKGMSFSLYDDRFIPGMIELADAIRMNGARACIQLWHAGRQINSALTGMEIVAPSSIPCPVCQEPPRELTVPEIKELVEAFGDAAVRAKTAGFDCVEIHGAHGYLVAQFMSPYSNKRSDEYGGTFNNRARFALEIIDNIKQKCGKDYPIVFRMSGEEYVEGGLTIEMSKQIAPMLVSRGVDCLHVSVGNYETLHWVVPPMDKDRGFNVWAAGAVKEVVDVPVIAVDRINNPDLAEEVLTKGRADFVAIGRGLLTDPEFAGKAREGREKEIKKCIACNQGCVDRLLVEGKHATCILNPACGRERQFELKPVVSPRKIMVIGGGPGGMEMAYTAARRGHRVSLYESDAQLGGAFLVGSYPPKKDEIKGYCEYMSYMLPKVGVHVRLSTRVTPEMVAGENPDAVVVATGSMPLIPRIPGVQRPGVVTAEEVLEQKVSVGHQIAVIGGGATGLETADFLAERGRRVMVLEMDDTVGKDEGPARKAFLMQRLGRYGVDILTNTPVDEISERGVVVSNAGGRREIDVDTVVLAVGSTPVEEMSERLRDMGFPVFVIGDAREPRRATEAIYEGVKLALDIEDRLTPGPGLRRSIMFGTRISPGLEFGVSIPGH
ncbi:MAG: NADH:flavin oxidoreductase [Firmicutes bacterium]|nr:NADH:flavin oxidoreductase [Bacillota bacterium]